MIQQEYSNKTLIYNPFLKVAGLPALLSGVLVLIIGALLAAYCNARLDGIIDLHFGQTATGFSRSMMDQILIWVALVAVFYPLCIVLGARPRLLDLAGTMALARLPMAFAPPVNAGGNISNITDKLKSMDPQHVVLPLSGSGLFVFVILSIIIVILVIWLVVLYFNAYKVCSNLKGNKLVISFIGGLLVAEILSVYLIRNVFNGI